MRKIILCILVLGATFSFGQKKELTLKDAVMEQYRAFYPKHTFGVSWIPNTSKYAFVENYSTLLEKDVKSGDAKVITSVQEINAATGLSMKYLTDYKWLSDKVIAVNDGTKYATFDISTKKGVVYAEAEGENVLANEKNNVLAYTVANNIELSVGGKKIRVTHHEDPNIVAGATVSRSEFGISGGLFWSANAKYLAFYEKNESFVANYPLLDIESTPGTLKSIKYPMAGQTSEQVKVGVFNVKTQKTVYIKSTGASEDYLTNLTFTPDEKFVVVAEVNRDQNHMKLNVFDAETGNLVRTLFEEKNDKWVEPEHPAFFLENKNNEFVWISERDGFNNLYHYDFNGKLISQLTKNKFVVKSIQSFAGNKIFFNATGDSPLNTMLYTVDLKGAQTLITTISGTHSTIISADGKYIYDAYSNHTTPNKEQLLSASGKVLSVTLTADNPLATYQYGTAEISSLKGNDGTELYTRLIKPSNFDLAKKYPVLIYVYGGPHAQLVTNNWFDGANLWMYWLAEQGYLVYTLDNRGSGERGFAFESQIHRQLGVVEMEDQMSGVNYLKSLPYVDGNRLAVHGWSFGGFMTTDLLLTHPGTFTCGVAGGPVTDWKYYEIMYGERYMDRPEQNIEGYKASSLIEKADKLKDELLLIHGTVDDVVVMQHNLALVKKFVELNIQMDFFPYPMHPHNVRGKDRVHLMTKVLNFVIEKNK